MISECERSSIIRDMFKIGLFGVKDFFNEVLGYNWWLKAMIINIDIPFIERGRRNEVRYSCIWVIILLGLVLQFIAKAIYNDIKSYDLTSYFSFDVNRFIRVFKGF